MRHAIATVLALITLVPAAAFAAPELLPLHGNLTTADGELVGGSRAVTFELVTAASGGEVVWSGTQTVTFVDGNFLAYLGADTALDAALFAEHPELFLEITVDGDTFPRTPIGSVPYAAFSATAAVAEDAEMLGGRTLEDLENDLGIVSTDLGGRIDEVQATVPDQATVEGWATAVAFDTEAELTDLLDDVYLSASYTPAWSDLTGVPADLADGDDDTTYAAGTGLTLSGTTFAVSQSQVETWAKAAAFDTEAELTALLDDDYKLSAGAGLTLSSGTLEIDEEDLVATLDEEYLRLDGGELTDTLGGTDIELTGTLQLGSTSASCASGLAGTVRYNSSDDRMEWCNGSAWAAFLDDTGAGRSSSNPGLDCKDLLARGVRESGTYWIDPSGRSAYQAYCDMQTDGGGWTLVHAKRTATFSAWRSSFVSSCASTTNANCASAVDPALSWQHAMWRFQSTDDYIVTWDSHTYSPFRDYLRGRSISNNPTFGGWSKQVNGAWTGPSTVASMHFYTADYISENHAGTDRWIDLWTSSDASNNYLSTASGATRGSQCLAGYCRNETVQLFVR